MDDSESMVDNESKVLAFEALSLVANALKMIEIKNLGLYRFGAETETVLNFGDELTDTTGGNLIEKCTFAQQSTNMVEMLQYTLRFILKTTEYFFLNTLPKYNDTCYSDQYPIFF